MRSSATSVYTCDGSVQGRCVCNDLTGWTGAVHLSLVLVPEYHRPRDFAALKGRVRDLDNTLLPEPPLSCSLCSSLPPPPVSSEPLRLELETFSLSIFTCHFFKHTYQSGELRGGGEDRCFSYAFLLEYNEALEREERKRGRKDICRDPFAIHILSPDDWQYIICIDAILNFNIACQKVQNDRS